MLFANIYPGPNPMDINEEYVESDWTEDISVDGEGTAALLYQGTSGMRLSVGCPLLLIDCPKVPNPHPSTPSFSSSTFGGNVSQFDSTQSLTPRARLPNLPAILANPTVPHEQPMPSLLPLPPSPPLDLSHNQGGTLSPSPDLGPTMDVDSPSITESVLDAVSESGASVCLPARTLVLMLTPGRCTLELHYPSMTIPSRTPTKFPWTRAT